MKEITFNDIAKANETIKTIDVKGKNYAEVNQRIKAFRMIYPMGTIETELLNNENSVCIIKAKVYCDGILLGTGLAYEKENSTFINKTSYIENCETSAVGRALGMCGFGIDTSIASAEEILNAITNQPKQVTDKKLKLMVEFNNMLTDTDTDFEVLKEHYKIKSNADMTEEQLEDAILIMSKKIKKNKEIF
jgi:hypothetical protein